MLDKPVARQIGPHAHPRRFGGVLESFTPNWFAVTMGTGILALSLAQFPEIPLLWTIGAALWLGNALVFCAFAMLFAARCLLCRAQTRAMMDHPVMPMFLGCIPMGLATVVNGLMVFGLPIWGSGVIAAAEILWWIDVGMSLACGIVVPLAMFTRQVHALEQMTAVWLLPLVASEVAAVSGGMLVPHLDGSGQQMTVLVVSLLLWSCSVPMALGVIVVLFLRLVLHKLPDTSMAASCWLALGPIATGALGMLVFSQVGPDVFAARGLGALSDAIGGACLLAAILFWGYGAWWFAIALAITLHYIRRGLSFNLGWWGYTFPLGVFAVCTRKLGQVIELNFFSFSGGFLVMALAIIWALVATKTLAGLCRSARPELPGLLAASR